MKVVKHLLKCYFKHIFIILVASKRHTYRFKSSLHVFLFRNRVNRTRPKCFIAISNNEKTIETRGPPGPSVLLFSSCLSSQ